MMDPNSTPEATTPEAGGTPAAEPSTQPQATTPSTTEPAPSADSQAGTTPTNDGDGTTPSNPDTAPAGEAAAEAGKDTPAPPKIDTDLDDWAVQRGYTKPTTELEKRALQDVRNMQRDFHSTRQKGAESLNREVADAAPEVTPPTGDEGDPLEKDLQEVKAELREEKAVRARSEFFVAQNVSNEESEMMATILKEKKDAGMTAQEFDAFVNPRNIGDWHTLAKARLADVDAQAIRDEATAKERERLAKAQAAGGPAVDASQTVTNDPSEDKKRLERFSNWDD